MSVKLAEFYRRAEEDPVFRDRKLKELRSHRNILPGLALFLVALSAAEGLYDGFRGEGWLNLNELMAGWFLAMGICLRVSFTRRIALLETMKIRDKVRPAA